MYYDMYRVQVLTVTKLLFRVTCTLSCVQDLFTYTWHDAKSYEIAEWEHRCYPEKSTFFHMTRSNCATDFKECPAESSHIT